MKANKKMRRIKHPGHPSHPIIGKFVSSMTPTPPSCVTPVFDFIHGLSCASRWYTSQLLKTKFICHWTTKDKKDLVRACNSCKTSKVHQHTDSVVDNFLPPQSHFAQQHKDTISYSPSLAAPLQYHFPLSIVDIISESPCHYLTSVNNLQSCRVGNGMVQHFYCTLKGALISLCNDSHWVTQLSWALRGLRIILRDALDVSAA
ncbi:uncharacterized protein [Palaemon carinicauda]|uniref:uncharacterized protein n=1 Tax=Palaemon carinicauda TaxID=392227 RepID=UPI0035B5F201